MSDIIQGKRKGQGKGNEQFGRFNGAQKLTFYAICPPIFGGKQNRKFHFLSVFTEDFNRISD